MGPDEVCVVVMSEARERACFDNAFAEFPGLEMKLRSAKLTGRERGAVTAMRSLARVQRNNVALIGDASGGVDAITGEGLRLAFRQAFALADAMIADDLKFYQRAHRCLLRRPRLTGHLMLWLGRNPGIRLRVIRAMQHNPELFSRLLAAHTGRTTPTEFLSTGAWLGWQLLSA
jgi:flavin-dependent dehydrogenase